MRTPSTWPAPRILVFVMVLPGLVPAAAVAQPAAGAAAVVWRTDYNSARREAQDKGLPLLLVVGTDDCFYCRKLEATTFRDPDVAALLAGGFVPLKLDATRDPALAKSLKVQLYPTTVLAGADGKIHAFIEGYVEAGRLAEQMKRASAVAATTDWMARDYNEASKAIGAGDYPRAVSLLKGLVAQAGDRPVGAKAKDVLAGVERQAAGGLARAKDLDQKGYTPEAMDALAEVVRAYAGTQAAGDAAGHMAGLAEKPENLERQRARQARDMLAMAKEEFRGGRYHDCLQRCELIATGFAERVEAREAVGLAAEIRDNPDRLAAACEQMNEKTAAMYLTLADSWAKKGQSAEASACLEKVMKLAPNSRQAEFAQARLAKIQGREPASAASFRKP